MINNCHEEDIASASQTYDEAMATFITDYDMENPITKNEGMLRKMENRLNSKDIGEDEKKALQQQMQAVS